MYNKIIFRNGVNANNQYFKDLNRFAPEVTANNANTKASNISLQSQPNKHEYIG